MNHAGIAQPRASCVARSAFARGLAALACAAIVHASSASDQLSETHAVLPQSAWRALDPNAAAAPADDYEQILREGIWLLESREVRPALLAFQRLVNRAPSETIEQYDAWLCERFGRSLAEVMAELRLRQALTGPEGHIFDLPFVTKYEASALGPLLTELQVRLMSRAHAGRPLQNWIADASTYTTLHAGAQDMVRDGRLLAAVVQARLRHDPRCKHDQRLRKELAQLRKAVIAYNVHVQRLPGFTELARPLASDDPTLRELRRLREVEAERKAREAEAAADPNTPTTQPSDEASTDPQRAAESRDEPIAGNETSE